MGIVRIWCERLLASMCFGGGTEKCDVLGRQKGKIGTRVGGGMCMLNRVCSAF